MSDQRVTRREFVRNTAAGAAALAAGLMVGVFMGEYFAPKREEDSNDSGHEEYEPPSDEEMEAELDRIDAEEEGRKPE